MTCNGDAAATRKDATEEGLLLLLQLLAATVVVGKNVCDESSSTKGCRVVLANAYCSSSSISRHAYWHIKRMQKTNKASTGDVENVCLQRQQQKEDPVI